MPNSVLYTMNSFLLPCLEESTPEYQTYLGIIDSYSKGFKSATLSGLQKLANSDNSKLAEYSKKIMAMVEREKF